MKRSPRMAKTAALVLAIAAHGALAYTLATPEPVMIEGAQGAAEVRLGTAFQDMAAGTLSSERAETTMTEPSAEKALRQQPDRVHTETPDHTPQEAPAQPLPAKRAEPANSERRPETLAALRPDRSSPLEPQQASPTQAAPAPQPDAPTAAARPQTLTGEVPDSAAVTRSVRPKQRSDAITPPSKPAPAQPKPATRKTERPKPAPGNAQKNARAGEATGKQNATAQQSGNGGRQQAAGNAAASNYPGLVMRKLSRAGKPRVNARGAAVVAFTVSANGGLASVAIARSSGSAALDQAAIRLVRGAGPFPKPPQGARRSFSIQIKGR